MDITYFTSRLRGVGWKILHHGFPREKFNQPIELKQVPRCGSNVHSSERMDIKSGASVLLYPKDLSSIVFKGIFLWFVLLFIFNNSVHAQNLTNSGQIDNTGVLRIKNSATGLPDTVNGTFELFGANQNLPAKLYQNVQLLGTGTKTTTGGNLSVQKNLTIASPVTLNITKGNILTLGDSLFESGVLNGAIQKSVDLTGSTTSSNFGNIGATISWSSNAPGITNVLRVSDSIMTGNGNQSIKRIYTITPTASDATGTLTFKYAASDLNGNSASILELWKSLDNGSTWLYQGGTVDTISMVMTKTNTLLAGIWTASDSLNPLGTTAAPGVPTTMAAVNSNQPTGQINTSVSPFSVLIRDAFNTPVKNVSVSFSVDSIPVSATGFALSDTVVLTDSLGVASTTLTIGSKVGSYRVRATATSLSPILFTARALHGPASLLAMFKGNNQTQKISTALDSVFTVTVVDAGGNPVDSATVAFAITTIPSGATGHQLSNQNVSTDSLGRASTLLTLGNRIGTYEVEATVNGLSGSLVLFSVDAIPGNPDQILPTLGNNQSGVNGTQLSDPITVTVVDIAGNPVQDDTVNFTIASVPNGAVGQQLSVTTAATGVSGQAATFVTLGNKTGTYLVQAQSKSLGGALVFSVVSLAGAPTVMNAANGNSQTAPISTTLGTNLTVHVLDASNNRVPSANVTFAITGAPSGATGQSVGTPNASTDTSGTVLTSLTLGNKVGTYEVTATIPSFVNAEAIVMNGKKMKIATDKVRADIQVKFTATAISGAPTAIASVSGMNQSQSISTQLDTPFVVRVLDAGSNPVVNTMVNYTITSAPVNASGQQLTVSSTPTDTLGEAKSKLTLGNKVGTYEVTALITTASNAEAITIGKKKIQLSKINGSNAVEVKFTITAKPGVAAAITASSGSNQSAQVGTQLPNPLAVHVVDAGLNAVPNASVSFTISETPTGATLPPLSTPIVVTDSLGNAQTTFTLGNKTGIYKVTATINGIPSVEFSVNAIPGNPSVLTALAGTGQTRQILNTLATPFAVQVFDASGNSIPQAQVKFVVASTPLGAVGTSISDSLKATDSLGQAVATLTLGSKVGRYDVSAIVSGVDTSRFSANATYGAASTFADVTGQLQNQVTETILDSAFSLSVRDIGDNSVPNTQVRFTIVSVPQNSTGYMLSDTVMTTDSVGNAFTYLQLGDMNGTYVVEASVLGVAQSQFSAEAFLMYGDINKDLDINIADITSMIDFFSSNKVLSHADSLKADFTHDGKIELADIVAMRESILRRPIQNVFTNLSLTKSSSTVANVKHMNSIKKIQALADASTILETTPFGLRVNLQNAVPVRGMELRIKLNDTTVNADTINLKFKSANSMDVYVRTDSNEVHVLAYNLFNAEIPSHPDTVSLFRIPGIYSVGVIDTSHVILALESNVAATSVISKQVADPTKYPYTFSLRQNYPNPFNSSTTIEFDVPDGLKGSKVILQVFNILGQQIKTLVSGEQDPGHYRVRWDGTNDGGMSVASGVYFYRFLTKDHGGSRKMILLK